LKREKQRFLKKARKNLWTASRGFGGAIAARSGPKVFWLLFFKKVTSFPGCKWKNRHRFSKIEIIS